MDFFDEALTELQIARENIKCLELLMQTVEQRVHRDAAVLSAIGSMVEETNDSMKSDLS